MPSEGFAWLSPYQPRQNLPAGTELAKPLKPALDIAVVELNPCGIALISLPKFPDFFICFFGTHDDLLLQFI